MLMYLQFLKTHMYIRTSKQLQLYLRKLSMIDLAMHSILLSEWS